jgi:hypothetical protein
MNNASLFFILFCAACSFNPAQKTQEGPADATETGATLMLHLDSGDAGLFWPGASDEQTLELVRWINGEATERPSAQFSTRLEQSVFINSPSANVFGELDMMAPNNGLFHFWGVWAAGPDGWATASERYFVKWDDPNCPETDENASCALTLRYCLDANQAYGLECSEPPVDYRATLSWQFSEWDTASW